MVDGPAGLVADAEAATTALIAGLQAQGFPIAQTSAIEQHKPGGLEHVHIQEHHHVEH